MDKRQRVVLLGVAAVIAAVAIVIALTAGGDDKDGDKATSDTTAAQTSTVDRAKPAAPEVTTVKVEAKGGEPVGGVQKAEVKKGDRVELQVTGDAPESVHLHGYDIEKPLAPGKTTRIAFKAKIDGVFEAELEESGTKIAEITVQP